jgi:tripartite ATP-independent transporter DctM subunit
MIEGILLLGILLLLVVMGVPVAFAFGISALLAVFLVLDLPLVIIAQQSATGADSFTLLAIPLFLLAGALMNAGGITRRLIRFANVVIGWMTGGLGLVNVGVSVFFAGISGSAVADTSAVGKAMIPGMAQQGYPRPFAAAVTAASSVVGPIIPPSIPIVVYAVASGLPIGTLFLAGVGPGLFFGAVLLALTYGISRKRGYPRQPRLSFKEAAKSFLDAIGALVMPLIILFGVVGGVFTVTEAAAAAAFYALILATLVYRELKIQDLPRVFIEAGISSAVIMFIIAVANLFGWVLVRSGFPQVLSTFLSNEAFNLVLVLALINVMLLVFGLFVEGNAAIIIFTPLLLPTATALGIDPLHFGILMVFNLMLGLITPPVGMCLFVASEIADVSIAKLSWALFPFLVAGLLTLIVITYWPPLTLYIPSFL